MRKILSMFLAAVLLVGLLSGCEDEAEPTREETRPAQTAAETEETTPPTEEAAEAGETEETAEATPLHTVVLRSDDPELQAEYILLAVSSEGPFHSEDITFNETGADALIQWLMSPQAREILENFGLEEYGEAVFSLPETAGSNGIWIPDATEENKTIHLSVADTLEESGLLDALLPVFEETYGYAVEVHSTSASGTLTAAKLGMFDLVLTESSDAAEKFVAEGYARVVDRFETEAVPFCTGSYLLCGPQEDPAGVSACETLQEAFAAIAAGEYIFLSRGDDSSVHKLEQRLWPENWESGGWYLCVETEMGPLLVMNEIEGGYVLTDKVTWLKYSQAEGII